MVYNSDHALHATRYATYIRKCTGHESAIGFKLSTGEDLASHLRIDKPALPPPPPPGLATCNNHIP